MCEVLTRCYQNILDQPGLMPSFMIEELTYMLPKEPAAHSLSAFRPIVCLPTLNQRLTAIISKKVYGHCEAINIRTIEQKGSCRDSRSCRDLLTIDNDVAKQPQKHQRKLHMAYIHYKEVFLQYPTITCLRFSGHTRSVHA